MSKTAPDSGSAPKNNDADAANFPLAELQGDVSAGVLQSRLWWLTLGCLIASISIAWYAHRPHGVNIVISFPQGHGLKSGDALRYRGIDVGVVSAVHMADDLADIRVHVMLSRSAEGIARRGSQFWIVRPQLSLTNISGLETAVGAKYIAVHPGETSEPLRRHFDGLRDPPAVRMDEDGLEFVLRSDVSFGLAPGSPISYRGVRVGQLLDLELGAKSKTVVMRARIDPAYETLLRKSSRFWKTTGVEVEFGLRGFQLSTESLASMAQGGISFITPESRADPASLEPAPAGHEFRLHDEADDDWLRRAAELPLEP